MKVVSATESIADGPEGIILESMLEGMAEYYSAELAQKVNRGMRENALKARSNGGTIPLGYRLDEEHRLKIDPLTAPVVREVFQRYADGENLRTIIRSLNERGIRTSRNYPFRHSSFNTMLKNRKYIGEYHYKDVIIPDAVPPIISKELFERVQERMKKNQHAPARAKAEEEYLLTTKRQGTQRHHPPLLQMRRGQAKAGLPQKGREEGLDRAGCGAVHHPAGIPG